MSLTKVTYSVIEGAVVNVLDYGVVGDGVTVNTVNLQSAIDNLSRGDTLYFPPGIYLTGKIDLSGKQNIRLLGGNSQFEAVGFPTIQATENVLFSMDGFKGADIVANRTGGIKFQGLFIQGVGRAITGSYGISMDASARFFGHITVEDCLIYDFDIGIRTTTSNVGYFRAINTRITAVNDGINARFNSYALIGCKFGRGNRGQTSSNDSFTSSTLGGDSVLVRIITSYGGVITGCTFEDADIGVLISTTTQGLIVEGNYFEAMGKASFVSYLSRNSSFRNNYLATDYNTQKIVIGPSVNIDVRDNANQTVIYAAPSVVEKLPSPLECVSSNADITANAEKNVILIKATPDAISAYLTQNQTFNEDSRFASFVWNSSALPTGTAAISSVADASCPVANNVINIVQAATTEYAEFSASTGFTSAITGDFICVTALMKVSDQYPSITIFHDTYGETLLSRDFTAQVPIDEWFFMFAFSPVTNSGGYPSVRFTPSVTVASSNAQIAALNMVSLPYAQITKLASSKSITRLAADPTMGYWNRGDAVWYTAPTAGSSPGAICTSSGQPGTWKAMANLAV